MAPKKASHPRRKRAEVGLPASAEPRGMFAGMIVFLVEKGVQPRRLQIWKHKLLQMGAIIEDSLSRRVAYIFAMDSKAVLQELSHEWLKCFKGNVLQFQWLENSLKSGEKLSEYSYVINLESEVVEKSDKFLEAMHSGLNDRDHVNDELSDSKKSRISEDPKATGTVCCYDNLGTSDSGSCQSGGNQKHPNIYSTELELPAEKYSVNPICTPYTSDPAHPSTPVPDASPEEPSLLYNPPDYNWNITDIFGQLINIYRALGDERRSFSYHKAIPVIEKLPFKIESVDQVKHLPNIGKSMQDHIHEIVSTGKLSKLEHFKTDEKVRTVALFGEVWGVGPATALKLYEKGLRTLDDLKNEHSLTNAQKLGVRFFNDIKKRIPRDEVKDMEVLLQKAGDAVLPGVVVVCGGSFRRGKSSCGDLDIVITHPDGQSHKGFLPKYVQYLKDIKFLREDLVFSIHSTEGTDSGVDTYFGLCTYPGQELRRRIDLKVYPRDIYAFGLIAWTGNDVLNRRLRLLAESKGYTLDDTGLFLAAQSSAGKRAKSSPSLSCKTEKEVFDLLGFPWLEPHERNL